MLENVDTNAQPRFRCPQVLCDSKGNRLEFGGHAATPDSEYLYGGDFPILLVGVEDGRIYWFYRHEVFITSKKQ